MKKSQDSRRALIFTAAFVLLLCGIILTGAALKRRGADHAVAPVKVENIAKAPASEATPSTAERPQREDESLTYVSQDGREKLKLVMDRFVARNAEGIGEIVPLSPPATPTTLAKRLAEHEAPRGIFPIAYSEEDGEGGYQVITSEIRAMMPREQAERFARENGLSIAALPDYAPDWVVFSAANPFDALGKIAAVRAEPVIREADVLTGRRYSLMAMPNDPLINDQWHLKASNGALPGSDMNVEGAWDYAGGPSAGARGRGVVIGIIDDSIQTSHPDFVGNIDTSIDFDFIAGDTDPNPVFSDDNHGTCVGGVAGGRGNNGVGVSGSAPEATLVGERLIGGDITDLDIANALAYRTDVIDIKNNSWGYSGDIYKAPPLIRNALKNSATNGRNGKGTIFTFSAGNSGDEEDNANYSELTSSIYTITVGATDSLNRRCFYSEPGANVVICGPSHGFTNGALGITTTDRTGTSGYSSTDYADDFSGTSSSCPAVTGGIALMLEKNPNLGWRDVQEILIRSAKKIKPGDADWVDNAAGLHFNHDFGAGLMDATAAVNLAANWTNLGEQTSAVSTKSGLDLSIPNNSSAGRELVFALPGSNIITEHVTLRLTINHSARGDLEITLISPSGTKSRLAEVRGDNGDNYSDYTFSTVRNWAEKSSGNWILKVADRKSAANTTGGTIQAAELTVFGVYAPPVNTPPSVRITSPSEGDVFSPGVGFTVNVDASDVDIDSNPSQVTKVELYENGVKVDTDTTIPFSFVRNPANNFYVYVAKGTDPEGLVGESPPVLVIVKNQTPVISSVTLNAASQAYDDLPLTVTAVAATDPENDPITLAYKWQFSTDQDNYTDSAITTASLPADPDNSGKLWRCRITASDGNTTSEAFFTGPVNLLDRPLGSAVRPGSDYAYQSGLVIRGDSLAINRQAIIHEFSQGPGGGTSEWIEILTLKAGSLAGWKIADFSGNTLTFTNAPWTNVPAGTLIVIYNGTVPKDTLLPADGFSFPSGAVVVSSTDNTRFTGNSKWPALDNRGDSIYLRDSTSLSIHELSYGESLFPSPNVGRVGASQAGYFAGQSDAGANNAEEWLVTASAVARTASFTAALSVPETNSLFPGAAFINGRYVQDFNSEPGPTGTFFPLGWSSYSVNNSATQTTNYDELSLLQTTSSAGASFNFGSRIGMISGTVSGGPVRFDPGFIALGLDNTRGLTGLQISYDIIKISEQAKTMQMDLQYTTGNPGNTGSVWTSIAGAAHASGSTPKGTVTRLNNVPLPAIFLDRESPIYLRWYYRTATNNVASGLPDALAIDNVIISSDSSPNIFLTLGLNPTTIAETDGESASLGTVTLSQAVSYDLTVNLSSSDITEATVPPFVVIPAGQLSVDFPIRAIDDIFADGIQSSTITASATGFLNVSQILTITNDEPIPIGVTPGLPNNTGNANFVDRVRTGRLYEAPRFFIAASTPLPDGLTIDNLTGLISGTISPSVPEGEYTVIIEIRNVVGGFSSQTIVIEVSNTVFSSYSQWISQYTGIDQSVTGNSDRDELPNLVEYVLNSSPDHYEQPAPVVSGRTAGAISITYTRSKDVTDVSLVAEWSATMEPDSWQTSDVVNEVLFDGVNTQTIRSSVTIDALHPARFIRLKAVGPPPPP